MFTMPQQGLEPILTRGPVIPVMVIDNIEDAVPLARALVAGGLSVLEITLRTAVAMESIRRIAAEVEGAVVGVGTIANPSHVEAAAEAGAVFAVSPGAPLSLVKAMPSLPIPLLPGIATPSEAMTLLEHGAFFAKLFPAGNVGGVGFLKALQSPFPQLRFCPTGGIDAAKAPAYLALPNVICIGGSWMAPRDLVRAGNWAGIESRARAASTLGR
jgi:2-dehydro-3-deoxyphosphogluconate aldolase/(4S)-4-hydroxy-2-oxoglutarate aldolase